MAHVLPGAPAARLFSRVRRRRERGTVDGVAPSVVVAGPPRRAVGGVAAYTDAVLQAMPEVQGFDQWWPLRARSNRGAVRSGVHVLGLVRWMACLVFRRPDVVHLQVTSPGLARDIIYLRTARLSGTRVVAHMHTSGFVGEGVSDAVRRRVHEILTRADGVVVMSETAASGFVDEYGVPRSRLHVVPNPAPVPQDLGQAPKSAPEAGGSVRFVCVGQISDPKGQVHLGKAAETLAHEGIEVEVSLVGPLGDIDPEAWLRLKDNPRVDLRGVCRGEALLVEYRRADAFALCSYTEAEPMAMLEAMAVGLPVIATSVGSIPDALASAGPGNHLIAPGDESALVAAMREVARDPAGARAVGKANSMWARSDRSMERHVARLRDVHRAVAQQPGSRG